MVERIPEAAPIADVLNRIASGAPIFSMGFAAIVICWSIIFVFFARRVSVNRMRERRYQLLSILCAFNALGWPMAAAREMRWISAKVSSVGYAAALIAGVFGAMLVIHNWSQR